LIPEHFKLLAGGVKSHGQVFSRLNSTLLNAPDRVVCINFEACM